MPRGPGRNLASVAGDSPLTELARFSGRVGVFVAVKPYSNFPATGGVWLVSGIPAGATIRRAWLDVTSFDPSSGRPVTVNFDATVLGPRLADVVDPGSTSGPPLNCSLYRFDVTELVPGNGAYAYTTTSHAQAYGDALVVVYEHASLPLRTIVIHDGAESLAHGQSTTTFQDMPCTSGELSIFTAADDGSGSEAVILNGTTLAAGSVFHANLGEWASLVRLPVTLEPGANVLRVFTGDDWFGLHLAILSAEGVRLDFETEDDFATPLVNGQALSTPDEFGALVALTSSGANAGAAVFDSTPAGPNDPSQDRDLLVDLGNVLILQNSQVLTQSVPGIFDRPNDDQDGGNLVFDFAAPSRPCCLALVDIDTGTAQASSVTLVDTGGRTRVYTVPPRWTEDVLADGPPGWRTLELDTLAPQPGFLSTATAVQATGFDPARVVRLTVHLGSSGAVDGLVFRSD